MTCFLYFFIGASAVLKETDKLSRIPHMLEWYRTNSAVVMQLTNGTVQVLFGFFFYSTSIV